MYSTFEIHETYKTDLLSFIISSNLKEIIIQVYRIDGLKFLDQKAMRE